MKTATFLLSLLLISAFYQCASSKKVLQDNMVNNENLIGSWKQISPTSSCPIYLKFSEERGGNKYAPNYIMRGNCDYRKVKRVWHCRMCDNQTYRDYRGAHYSLSGSNLYFIDLLDKDTIPEEVISIIELKPEILKMSIYNNKTKIYDTLNLVPTPADSIPIGWQRCECEWRTD